MQHKIITALPNSIRTLKCQQSDKQDIERLLKECLLSTYNELPVNSVMLRNLTLLVAREIGDNRPLELLLEVTDTAVTDLERMWRNTLNDELPLCELLKTLGLQLDLFTKRFESMADILPIYHKDELRKILQQRCYRLLIMVEQVLLKCTDQPVLSVSDLLTVVVILHRFISLRVLKIDSSLSQHSSVQYEDSADEARIVKSISSILNIESKYAEWIHRSLSVADASTVMSGFEIIPYLDTDVFLGYHMKLMINRFINHLNHSTSLEGSIIRRISDGADAGTMWRVSQLVADLDNSHRIAQSFFSENGLLHPLIVQQRQWQLGDNKRGKHPVLPANISNELVRYESHVKSSEGYNLVALPDNGWAIIEFSVNEEKHYNIKVSMSQLAVICCFNDKAICTAKEIGNITALGSGRAGLIAMNMMKCKMLRRKPYVAGSKEIHELDSFVINPTFSHADMDFSIVSIDDNSNNITAVKWTASELRKAIRRELRDALPKNEMHPSDLQLAVHLSLGGVDLPSFNAAIDKMVDAGLVESVREHFPKAPKVAQVARLPGVNCPAEIREWLWGNVDPNRAINSTDLLVNYIKNQLRAMGINLNNASHPIEHDLPQVLQDHLISTNSLPTWALIRRAIIILARAIPGKQKKVNMSAVPAVIRLVQKVSN